jgi:GMP synthase (glutamine-hydrolysing)
MMVIQHEPSEGPGSLASLLPHGTRIVRAWEEEIPHEAHSLLLLGGGASAYDDTPINRAELRLIRACISAGGKVLGICLGSQLLSIALGGTVARAPRKEIGFYRVRLENEPDPLFGEAPRDFVAFHWHGDAFALPPGAVPLASSTMTPLQAFRLGRAWGVQFHLEMEPALLGKFIETGAADLSEAGVDAEQLIAAAPRECSRLGEIARPLFERFLSL